MKFHRNKTTEEKEKENKSTKNKMLSKDFINKLSGKELNELMKEYMEDIFPPKEKDNKNFLDNLMEKEETEKNKEDNHNEVKYMYIPTIKLIINTNTLLKTIALKESENNKMNTEYSNNCK